ncbi:hypothetical protein ABZ826_17920 [Streptomyces sp. NPDC047515]|uniref:hypothetical protein n=1 Tax=Streptomyces sp. NPDC047515 TaxID=3155380 RepID=UPI0033C1E815
MRAGEMVRVDPGHAVQGIGSQSCGPWVLSEYRIDAAAAKFPFVVGELGRTGRARPGVAPVERTT